MAKFLEQLREMWARLTPRQRMVVGGGTLATVVLVGALAKSLGTPEMKPLMMGLEPADAQAMVAQLGAKKINAQVTADGKGIDVAAEQLDAARMEVASEGAPHSGRMGFELFDKVSWGQTEFDEKVNYQRALEGELERTIGTLSDVRSARVHLVMPRSSVFLERERGAKASVTLKLKHGAVPPVGELEAINRLVSGAVDNLTPADVAIIDADSNEALGRKGGSAEGRELEEALEKKLVATLGPAVGAENLRASVTVEYDLSTSEESQDKYDPQVSALLETQKSQEQTGAGAAQGGVAGTSGNLPVPGGNGAPAAEAGAVDGAQMSSSENSRFGVNKVMRHTVSPAGRIRRMTAAVLVNDGVDRKQVNGKWQEIPLKRSAAQLKQIQDLAQAVLGLDTQRGDVLSVENMPFDDGRLPEAPPTVLSKVRDGVSSYAAVLRYAALILLFGLVYLLMFRPAQKQVMASMRELAAGKPATATAAEAVLPAPRGMVQMTGGAELKGGEEVIALGANGSALKKQLAELVQAEPVSMTRTVQSWLREDRA